MPILVNVTAYDNNVEVADYNGITLDYAINDINIEYNKICIIINELNNEEKCIIPQLPDSVTEIKLKLSITYESTSTHDIPIDIPYLPSNLRNLIIIYITPYFYINILPELPESLEILDINSSGIKELPILPKKLLKLYCSNCLIKSLPDLPPKLRILECLYTDIKYIPILPKSLKIINCSGCDILDVSDLYIKTKHLSLKYFLKNIEGTPSAIYAEHFRFKRWNIKILSDDKYNMGLDKDCWSLIVSLMNEWHMIANYNKYLLLHKKMALKKIANWFLDCKYNPKYKYCRERLKKEHNELFGE